MTHSLESLALKNKKDPDSLNVNPDLSHFTGIVPCGVRGHGVTSLADLGIVASMADVDVALKRSFGKIFG